MRWPIIPVAPKSAIFIVVSFPMDQFFVAVTCNCDNYKLVPKKRADFSARRFWASAYRGGLQVVDDVRHCRLGKPLLHCLLRFAENALQRSLDIGADRAFRVGTGVDREEVRGIFD